MGNAIRSYTTGYIENMKDRLTYIVDFLYDNSDTLNEEKCCSLLFDLFKNEGFNMERDIHNINSSFKASYGSGKPSVAYICDYASMSSQNYDLRAANECGHFFSSALNAGAAIGLKHAIKEIGGRVVIYGCPSNSKIQLYDKGEFNDISAIIYGHAAYKTYESGSSLGCSTVDIVYNNKQASENSCTGSYNNATAPAMLLFNLCELLKAKYPGQILITSNFNNAGINRAINSRETSCSFVVNSLDQAVLDKVCKELIDSAKFTAEFYDYHVNCSQSENMCEPLKTHTELSKLACHNLKECGIINIHAPVDIPFGIDIGTISKDIPVINPGIGICKKETAFNEAPFNEHAKSSHAKENMIKAACALALTGVDVIQNPNVLEL